MIFEEFSNAIGLPIGQTFKEYQYINVGGKFLCVQNYLKLLVYQPDKIVLKVRNNELIVDGKNLVISELEENTVIIKGEIRQISTAKE